VVERTLHPHPPVGGIAPQRGHTTKCGAGDLLDEDALTSGPSGAQEERETEGERAEAGTEMIAATSAR
jgi:hypothetical protein